MHMSDDLRVVAARVYMIGWEGKRCVGWSSVDFT
jgi:hypothetical protein